MDDKTQEPSMEDILASIRKILSEDDGEEAAQDPQSAPEAAAEDISPGEASEPEESPEPAPVMEASEPEADPTPEPVPPDEEGEEDVLELTDDDMVVEEDDEEPLILETAAKPRLEPEPAANAEPLVSEPTEAASTAAFSELAAIARRDRALGVGHGQLTLEALVRDMMRPMIAEWLDAHLPGIVESMVRKEIERLASSAEKQ